MKFIYMTLPIKVNLDITQDDFIAVDILEQAADIPLAKKAARTNFLIESGVLAGCLRLFFLFRDKVAFEVVYFLAAFWLMFGVNFALTYFKNIDSEFSLYVTNLLKNSRSGTIYTPEKGEATFWADRREYLTNEQRRYFEYDKVQFIKETRHLFIFIMKRTKEKNLNGFAWMVLPKRNMTIEDEESFRQLCRSIKEKYNLKEWTDFPMFD